MKKDEILKLFSETGVIQEGHFELSSGKHADKYLQCARILQYPDYAEKLAESIATFWDEDIDLVVGPAIGGIIVSYAVGKALNVRSIFSERKNGVMKFRRSLEVKENEKVLIVEDVVTTGGSVREVVELVEKSGGNIVGISSLVDRSNGEVEFKYPFKALVELKVESYEVDDCELCKKGVEMTKPGSKKI